MIKFERVNLTPTERSASGDIDAKACGSPAKDFGPSVRFALPEPFLPNDGTFDRVSDAYDLARLSLSRLVIVGTGGAAEFAVDMARAGVGQIVLIDPDVVSVTNICTQAAWRRDIGRPKVECVAELIHDINPYAEVLPIQKRVEEVDDSAFRRLLFGWSRPCKKTPAQVIAASSTVHTQIDVRFRPAVVLLCVFTDDFYAQARGNRLALKFGVPSLSAQLYHQGCGAELSYTYPGVTPACQRCILRTRYAAYLEDGFKNDVTSTGTPIFATRAVNAIKGFLALSLLHHGSGHPRWGPMVERLGSRNLVQIRLHPDLELPVFKRVFSGADTRRILFGEPLWLPQKPNAACPDCAGTGDLRDALGRFDDTREMTRQGG